MGKGKALVADGDPGFADLLSTRLTEMGFETATAVDGNEALRWVRRERPQLVVADESLAGIDGFKLCRLLKFDKPHANVTIVLLSTAITDENSQLAEIVHANFYLPKQPDHPDLLAIAQDTLPKE